MQAESLQTTDVQEVSLSIPALIEEALGLSASATNNVMFVTSIVEAIVLTNPVTARFIWELINDTQTANWQNIANTQSASWGNVNTTQSANWTPVETT